MLYPYQCPKCGHSEHIVKVLADIDREEKCPKCAEIMNRYIEKVSFYGANDWDTAHYSPALGKVVKSHAELRRIAKQKGWEEVGNEDPDKIHKHFEQQREKAFEDSWSKV